jgi:type IV pilus assembly protein PilO
MRRISLFELLETGPRWQKLAAGLLALVAVAGVGYFIAVLPVGSRVATLRGQRDIQQRELGRLRALAVEITRVRREAADVERQLENAKEKLPTEREIPTLYRTLSDAAVQAGLAVALFRPRGPRVHDFYNEIPISVVAEGGYHEVGDFIGRVATLPRATMISELKLTGAGSEASPPAPPPGPTRALPPPPGEHRPRTSVGDAGKPQRPVRAEITLLTYVYRPVGSPPAPKPAGPATAKLDAPRP